MTLIVLLGINVAAELIVALRVARLLALQQQQAKERERQKALLADLDRNVRRLQQLINADRS